MLINVCIRLNKFQDAVRHIDAYLEENPQGAKRAEVLQLREQLKAIPTR